MIAFFAGLWIGLAGAALLCALRTRLQRMPVRNGSIIALALITTGHLSGDVKEEGLPFWIDRFNYMFNAGVRSQRSSWAGWHRCSATRDGRGCSRRGSSSAGASPTARALIASTVSRGIEPVKSL